MSTDTTESADLPAWVPWQGWHVYEAIDSNGGFSDARRALAAEQLYWSPSLKGVWNKLVPLSLSLDGWNHLILSIISAVECVPTNGKRATRESPSEKTEILDRQINADKLMQRVAIAARELSGLLRDLAENGGEVPAETYSGLALIESAIDSCQMARACCQAPFKEFRKGLSSYARSNFPPPIAILDALLAAMEAHPGCHDYFADDPWLSSQQSSWRDYVRVLKAELAECHDVYGDAPEFTDAEWTALLQALVDKDLTRQVVAVGLKEMQG